MSDKCNEGFKEAVCIHTDKVYDSCRDKDCLENIRVYLTACGQEVIDCAINVKCTKAEIIWVFSDVDRSKYNFQMRRRSKQITCLRSADVCLYFKLRKQVRCAAYCSH